MVNTEIKELIEELNKQISLNDTPNIASSYSKIGRYYQSRGKFQKVINNFERSYTYYFDLADYHNIVFLISFIANCEYEQGNHEEALIYLEKELNKFIKLDEIRVQAILYRFLGGMNFDLENDKVSLNYLNKSFKLSTKLDEYELINKVSYYLCVYYFTSKQYEEALTYIELILDNYLKYSLEDDKHLVNYLFTKGEIFYSMDKLEESITIFENSYEIARTLSFQAGEFECLIGISKSFFHLEDYTSSTIYLNKAEMIKINEETEKLRNQLLNK